ncbi:NADP-dependent oxidoreductase domain-containing protein [Mycena albidolilacea]|uniref:NADP-dependent oxidoreductase domain-containing protein n=1 Tax=Mycena albidolilacea TaxID=1033008 RepID=A0AAD7ETC1_9AGAR|nr:NADP-dependent oxidoreductase domain-containing protein [Mycena albidolilacea]
MSAAEIPLFKLKDGSTIPSVGMGCYMGGGAFTEKQVHDMCRKAIKAGYRHFDTATGYGNEQQVGDAIRDSGIPRSEFYITTKLANGDHHRVCEAFEESFTRLNVQYIDLFLLHWPQASTGDIDFSQINAPNMALPPDEHPTFVETWKEIEKLLETVRSIGVSNFSIKTLEELLSQCSIVPATNQVELHPCLPQDDLKAYCDSKGILLTAYSLACLAYLDSGVTFLQLGRSKTFFAEQPFFRDLAVQYKVTPAQIILSWGVQRGTVVVPKSENENRMLANITLVKLSEEDMHKIGTFHLKPGMHKSLVEFHADDCSVYGWKYEWLGWNMTKGGVVPQ